MRVALVLLVAALAVLAAAVVYTRVEDDAPEPAPRATATPSYEQRVRLSERVTREREGLAAQGIYLVGVSLEDACARVALLNPTPANVAHLETLYPGTCVSTEAAAVPKTCRTTTRPLTRDGDVEVPDVLDLRPQDASRRVLADDLTFTLACLGDGETAPWQPRGPQDALLRVTAQCPRPGERVRPGTEVALHAAVVLPGGFEHRVGALDEIATGTTSPCGDGRNPTG
jgi:hypothetical protein